MRRKEVLTRLPDMKNLTEHEGKLDATSGKWAFMFIFSATVLKNELRENDVSDFSGSQEE